MLDQFFPTGQTTDTQPQEGDALYQSESERQRFDSEVRSILQVGSSDSYSLFSFIRRIITQFHLQGVVDVADIVNESYLRGIKLVGNGKRIHRPLAWLRSTSYNIVRELSREWDARRQVSPDFIEEVIVQDSPMTEIECEEHLKLVWDAFEKLSRQDQEILRLRMIENLSWQEVGDYLANKGETNTHGNTLRSQGHRATKHLREQYHQLEAARQGLSQS